MSCQHAHLRVQQPFAVVSPDGDLVPFPQCRELAADLEELVHEGRHIRVTAPPGVGRAQVTHMRFGLLRPVLSREPGARRGVGEPPPGEVALSVAAVSEAAHHDLAEVVLPEHLVEIGADADRNPDEVVGETTETGVDVSACVSCRRADPCEVKQMVALVEVDS